MPGLDDDISEPDSGVEEPKDDIPDFDENFDIDVKTPELEKPLEKDQVVDTPEQTASALDELDSVLDSLNEEDEQNIPQLDDDQSVDADSGASSAEATEQDDELEGEAAVDAALANLENELEDIGLENNKNDK
jgi:hypothetical protein